MHVLTQPKSTTMSTVARLLTFTSELSSMTELGLRVGPVEVSITPLIDGRHYMSISDIIAIFHNIKKDKKDDTGLVWCVMTDKFKESLRDFMS